MAHVRKYDFRYLIRSSIIVCVDALLIVLALFLYLRFFHLKALSPYYSVFDNIIWVLFIVVLWFFYAYIFNLYRLSNINKKVETIKNTIITAVLTGITYLFIPFVTPTLPLHRFPAFILISSIVVLLLIWRLIYAKFFAHPIFIKKTIIVGAGWIGREILQSLVLNERIYHNTGYKIFGFIDDDETKWGKEYDGFKVLGSGEKLLSYAIRLKLDEIILAIPGSENLSGALHANMIECENRGIQIMNATELYEMQTGKLMVKKKMNQVYLADPYHILSSNRFYFILNRFINVMSAIIACTFLVAITPLIFISNLIFSQGPLFYKQLRIGKNGKEFSIIKFRTMIVNAEKDGIAQYASVNDERVTKVGKFLRKTRIDELPQCWNILLGEMNLIGPRPERNVFIETLSKEIPFFKLRNAVTPGLTGWAQVNYKYTSDTDDALVKLQYDLYYIKHRSIFLDLSILLKTISVVMKFKGT